MLKVTFEKICNFFNVPCNHLDPNTFVPNVSCLLEKTEPGDIFVFIPNLNRKVYSLSDNEVLTQLKTRGISFLIAEKAYPDFQTIVVNSPLDAYCSIARLHREYFSIPIIAISGSNGKTTTRDITHHVLTSDERYAHSLQNLANANARRQVAGRLMDITDETEAMVMEFGGGTIGEVGEMSRLCNPQIAALTLIGSSHLGNVGSPEGLFKSKMEIVEGMTSQNTLIVNADSQFLKDVKPADITPQLLTVSAHSHADYYAQRVRFERNILSFDIVNQSQYYPVSIPYFGKHNITNMLISFAICTRLGMSPENVAAQLSSYRPHGNRQNVMHFGTYTVINDSFNAAPESVIAGLEFLSIINSDSKGRRIAVLSSLGGGLQQYEKELHQKVGRHINNLQKLDRVYCVGESAKLIAEEITNPMIVANHAKTNDELAAQLQQDLHPGDILFFKGNRNFKLEFVIKQVFSSISHE